MRGMYQLYAKKIQRQIKVWLFRKNLQAVVEKNRVKRLQQKVAARKIQAQIRVFLLDKRSHRLEQGLKSLALLNFKQKVRKLESAFELLHINSNKAGQKVEELNQKKSEYVRANTDDAKIWYQMVPSVGKFEMAKQYHRQRMLLHSWAQLKYFE